MVEALDVVEGEGSVRRLKSARDQIERRQDQEQEREGEERQDAEPGPRYLSPLRPRDGNDNDCRADVSHGPSPNEAGRGTAKVVGGGRCRPRAVVVAPSTMLRVVPPPPSFRRRRNRLRAHVALTQALPRLLHVDADDGVPLLGDHGLGSGLLFDRREHGGLVGGGRRKLVEQLLRNFAVRRQIVERIGWQ